MVRMKYRIFSIFCGLLLAVGCTGAPGTADREELLATVAATFSFTGTAVMEGLSQPVKLTVMRRAEGLTIELSEPEAVKGLMVEFDGEATRATFHGMVMNLSPGDIPQQSLFIALGGVLSAMPDGEAAITHDKGMLTISGRAGLLPYDLLWSAGDLTLKTIRLPSIGGLIEVENFTKAL